MSERNWSGDFFGAFADAAILFPLIAALSISSGFSGTYLLAGAGIAYIVSGWIFKIPMSVQPLKSIAIAAVAAGATSAEVRWAGAALGVFCLLASRLDVDTMARRVPTVLIHGVQTGLGIILIYKGWQTIQTSEYHGMVIFIPLLMVAAILWAPNFKGLNLLGLIATIGMGYAIFSDHSATTHTSLNVLADASLPRISMILTLVLPQMALTLANSVVATKDVCQRYFGVAAAGVTMRKLLLSIGAGNVLMAALSSLPFCHGAGGVTAHYRAGARTWIMNIIIGGILLALAVAHQQSGQFMIRYPAVLLAVLLASTGFFHLKLAADSWAISTTRYQIIVMGLVAAVSQNILVVLCVGIAMAWLLPRLRLNKQDSEGAPHDAARRFDRGDSSAPRASE